MLLLCRVFPDRLCALENEEMSSPCVFVARRRGGVGTRSSSIYAIIYDR
jgi:hypothetical protein